MTTVYCIAYKVTASGDYRSDKFFSEITRSLFFLEWAHQIQVIKEWLESA